MSIDDAESKSVQRADMISWRNPASPRAMAQLWFQRNSGLKMNDRLRINRFCARNRQSNVSTTSLPCCLSDQIPRPCHQWFFERRKRFDLETNFRPPARIIFDVDENSINAVNISGHAPEGDKHVVVRCHGWTFARSTIDCRAVELGGQAAAICNHRVASHTNAAFLEGWLSLV
jgi:hypothetical protein